MNEDDPELDASLAWLLELRVKVRGNRYATQLVDRCLGLCAQPAPRDVNGFKALQAELDDIADSLALRFGAPKARIPH